MIPLKQWLHEQAARLGINAKAMRARLDRGGRWPELVRVNKRVILVRP